MSKLVGVDFIGSIDATSHRIIGNINKKSFYQAVAAALAASVLWQADFDGTIGDGYVVVGTAPAAGESMTVDILRNGSSILLSVLTIDSTVDITKQIQAKLDPTKTAFKVGDIFTCTRGYTAGGGPTPMAKTTVFIEPSTRSYNGG